MRDGWILVLIVILSVTVGGLLFMYGGASFHASSIPTVATTNTLGAKGDGFTVLAQGDQSGSSFTSPANYRIMDSGQFAQLWSLVYGASATPVPDVDFSKNEVLAVFDGSHSTTGYGIQIDAITDSADMRTVTITHLVPDSSCSVLTSQESPFEIVQVSKSALPVTHSEQTASSVCP